VIFDLTFCFFVPCLSKTAQVQPVFGISYNVRAFLNMYFNKTADFEKNAPPSD